MFDGKLKALTFSFDDGITQDQRLIEIFNKYDLKCTFNINSELLGKAGSLIRDDATVAHCKPRDCEIAKIYKDHEVAAHTLTHPLLTSLPDEEVIRQVETDRINLSKLVGYEVKGMAYPCGGKNNDERVAKLIKENTGIKYSRTITSTKSFDLQSDLIRFDPTERQGDHKSIEELTKKFIDLKPDSPKLFYIWGHSFEFDTDNSWSWFEDICKELANRKDIFYGTNSQVFGV